MIEERDWDGAVERYGSVPRLLDELTEIRAAISEAHPSVEHTTEHGALEQCLAAAWQTAATDLRLVTIAAERRLPLWTTGQPKSDVQIPANIPMIQHVRNMLSFRTGGTDGSQGNADFQNRRAVGSPSNLDSL
jgi:hypothetical protein